MMLLQRYLFPKYPELSERLFTHWQAGAGLSTITKVIAPSVFRTQADRLMSIMADEQQIQMYVTVSSSQYTLTNLLVTGWVLRDLQMHFKVGLIFL